MADHTISFPQIPEELTEKIGRWADLKRWERRELGQALRALGLSYREIAGVIPVGKGTLSEWCRDVELSPEQEARLRAKRPSAAAMRANGARKRREALARQAAIRDGARAQVSVLATDPFWIAGVVAYWSEGSKTSNELRLANSDPAMVRMFIGWAKRYLDIRTFTARLHLHSGHDEAEQIRFWSNVTGIEPERFGKTFFKQEGTGHRKRILYHGVIQVRGSRSTVALHRVMGWIAGLSELPWPPKEDAATG